MTRLVWGKAGTRKYETGVDHGVLYPLGDPGVAWNGLVSVTESPSGAEASAQYSDNVKYLNLISPEEFGGTIEAFTSPREFAACDGSGSPIRGLSFGQQRRKLFHLAYRTRIGNDLAGADFGYKIHLVYNVLAAPAEKANATISDSPEAITFSWEFSNTPVDNPFGGLPISHLVFDSTKISSNLLATFEDILYGETSAPRMILPDEILQLILTQPVAYQIVPNPTTGIAELVDGGDDLRSGSVPGVYIAPPGTHLTATVKPGRYSLEK